VHVALDGGHHDRAVGLLRPSIIRLSPFPFGQRFS
jgi:hypothetical protein